MSRVRNVKLSELSADMMNVLAGVEEFEAAMEKSGGDLGDEDFRQYAGLKGLAKQRGEDIEEKICDLCLVAEEKEMEAAAIGGEVDRLDKRLTALKKRKAALAGSAERIRKYLIGEMNILGLDRFKHGVYRVRITESERLIVYPGWEEKLAPEFIVTKTTTQVDKAAVKAAIKAGDQFPADCVGIETIKRLKFD